MTDSLSSTFTGRVAAVNERGLRLDGHDSWLNVSKFAVGVVLPERGATVTVTVDSKGFIRSLETAEPGPAAIRGGSGAPEPASARETAITRLAVLKAAAAFAASRDGLKSGDVLKIAESWERWVNRSLDPVDELDAPF